MNEQILKDFFLHHIYIQRQSLLNIDRFTRINIIKSVNLQTPGNLRKLGGGLDKI